MRGMFTARVTDVMMENGISFDGNVGVSAEAAFGVNYKSDQIGRAIRYNERFCRDKRYCSIRNIFRDGNLYSKDFCYGEVPLVHDPFDFEAFEANPMEFHIVCTNVVTGKSLYHVFKGRDDTNSTGFEPRPLCRWSRRWWIENSKTPVASSATGVEILCG